MGTARFTQLARKDLQEIQAYIAQNNPKAAAQYLRILKQKCGILAQTSTIGVCRKEYCNLYKFPVDKYLVFTGLPSQALRSSAFCMVRGIFKVF